SERRSRILILVCRKPAAQPTLVVKISDTSYQWKERVRIPPVKSRTVERPYEGIRMRHGSARPLGLAGVESLTPISPVPQRAFLNRRCLEHGRGGGEDVC